MKNVVIRGAGTGGTVVANRLARRVHLTEEDAMYPAPITAVSIVCSKGSLEGIYPALILANGARAEGIKATLFFTFFGLDAVVTKRMRHIKVATVGNPGLHLPTVAGALPGGSAAVTAVMERTIEKLDIPPIPELIEMVAGAGCELYACKASVEMFGFTAADCCPQVKAIITVGELYAKSAGAQIILT